MPSMAQNRAEVTFFNPNYYGIICCFCIMIGFYLLSITKSWFWKFIGAVAIGINLFGLKLHSKPNGFPSDYLWSDYLPLPRRFVARKHSGSASPHLQLDSCSSSQVTSAFVWEPSTLRWKNAFRFGMPAWFSLNKIHGSVKGL